MSKAYDRVNMRMLRKTMKNQNTPHYIDIIIGLFTDRKHSIITEFGNPPFYDVVIGIDQGEVISPFL